MFMYMYVYSHVVVLDGFSSSYDCLSTAIKWDSKQYIIARESIHKAAMDTAQGSSFVDESGKGYYNNSFVSRN